MTILNQDKVIEEINMLMLEQQVTILENSLSSTIGFFTLILAFGAILFAILVAVASSWLNRTFNVKLETVKAVETKVSNELLEIKQYKEEIKSYKESIQEMYESTKKFKTKADMIVEKYEKVDLWFDFLEAKLAILDKTQESMLISERIEQKLKKISNEDIKDFFNDEFEGDPLEQFHYYKKFYLDAKDGVNKLRSKSYEYVDFIEGIDDDNTETISENIEVYSNEMKGFLEKLDEIKENK